MKKLSADSETSSLSAEIQIYMGVPKIFLRGRMAPVIWFLVVKSL
jgi:hypothetical protein